jgi:hypothetical protein
MEVMPEPLNYATPDLNRRSIDAIPFVLGSLQFLLSIATIADSGLWFGTYSKYWYERPAQLCIAVGGVGLINACGAFAVVAGASRIGEARTWWYRLYAIIWIGQIVLTELSVLVLSPWPGERKFRWIMVHNLHDTFLPVESFSVHPILFSVNNPALWLLAWRFLFNRWQDISSRNQKQPGV